MKKNHFKKWTAGLVFCLAVGLLGGCAAQDAQTVQKPRIRIGSLKGPTSMGLLFMMEKAEAKEAAGDYLFQMETAPDRLLPLLIKGELDIVLVPANVASVLYEKTRGGVSVIDINTLGVLYMVSGQKKASEVEGIADLQGSTVYLTGKGTTPDFVLQYLLEENGLSEGDVTLEYKSEAAEVAAILAENPNAVGLLPQPFVTAACMQNQELSVMLDMNREWEALQGEGGSRLVTGVTVVRDDFLKENEEAVKAFLTEHKESTEAIHADPEKGAALCVEAGIVAEETVAKEAVFECGITYLEGEQMKQALSGYLTVLFERAPESVGGALPGNDFYYVGEDGKD